MKTAIIDVGSNSVRYALLSPDTVVATKQLNSTVLADGLFFSGKLSDDAIARTVNAIVAFCDLAQRENADEIHIFATEAVRAASNRKTFTDAVREKCGIPVDVLSGTQEAQIGFFGAAVDPDRHTAVFDMGGASCEVICGHSGVISYAQSFPVGCVRLRDGASNNRATAERLIADALPCSLAPVQTVVGIGGTATALGGMLHCPRNYDPNITHGSVVPHAFLRRVADEFFAREDMQTKYPSLSPARARIIGYGALAVMRILDLIGQDGFIVSERDNIEGYYESIRKKRIT